MLVDNVAVLVVLAVAFVVFLASASIVIRYLKIWFQAYMSSVPISIFQIVSMSFRKISARSVVSALIMAKQAGITLACQEVESAYMRGADVEKIAAALVATTRGTDQQKFTFQELVDTDLNDHGHQTAQGPFR